MSRPVAALVLAAGLSSRMVPENKLLAPMPDGRALVLHTVSHALASDVSTVTVVTGFQAPLIEAALAGLPIRLIHAPDFARGLAHSLRAGIASLTANVEAALIILGDMPLVEPMIIDRLLAAFDPNSGRDIVVPVWRGRRGNPRLFGRRFFDELQSLSGDAGANCLLDAHPDRIVEIAASDAGDTVLRDFDTHEALDALFAENHSQRNNQQV